MKLDSMGSKTDGSAAMMKKGGLHQKIGDSGLVIISAVVALLYWHIDTLQLGAVSTRTITFLIFISYGVFTQYFINTNKRMAAKMLSLSLTDHLTGLYNRRGLMTLAEQQLKVGKRTKESMLLLFGDIDNLKWINDNLGHSRGDDVIVHVADILKEIFRESDIIARIGGDEFVVLALRAAAESSDVIEERLQQQIDSFNAKEGLEYQLSISSGIVHVDSDSCPSIDELMLRADALMYEQKSQKQLNVAE